MISGAHTIIYSSDADADRAFLRDVIGLPNVDVGGGWLIFGLPPAEVAVHPAQTGGSHEFYLMCDDIHEFASTLSAAGYRCEEIEDQGWGLLSKFTLPGGGRLGVYQPRHERPSGLSLD